MLIAVNYHYVRPRFDAPYPGIHGITPDQLRRQLELLGNVGTFVSGDEVMRTVQSDASLPARSFIVTFDDGLREQYEHALPILTQLGIPAIFFVNTHPLAARRVSAVHKLHLVRANRPPEWVDQRVEALARSQGVEWDCTKLAADARSHYQYDTPGAARLKYLLNVALPRQTSEQLVRQLFREQFGDAEAEVSSELYMTIDHLRDLSTRGYLGSHAHEHLPLGALPPAASRQQVHLASQLIDQWTGRRPFALSYPYGTRASFSAAVLGAASEAGICFAFTMERAANRDLTRPLLLARLDNNDAPGGKSSAWKVERLFDEIAPSKWTLDEKDCSCSVSC